ncbi:MAG: thiamine-phosphate kinase [Hydrogenophilaceae bacterium]|nr:thiamine-phosphate kinase [Hydrogenophilaceae bacterium]
MPGEFDLIAKYFSRPTPHAVLGVGDDCALIKPTPDMELAISTDMLIAGRHFMPSDGPGTIGHKAMAVNLSDLAAMGARPRYALLSIALPEADEKFLQGFAGGFFGLAQKHGVEVIGGDTTRGGLLTISVTIIGEVPPGQALRRDAAQAGDDIWVSGTLGDAAAALAHHQGKLRLETGQAVQCFPRLFVPSPRIELGLALRRIAHACIDVSDGFAADLGHILERSYVGADVWFEQLPLSDALLPLRDNPAVQDCVLAGGDDYELVFTAPVDKREQIESIGKKLDLRLTRAGQVTPLSLEGRGVKGEGEAADKAMRILHHGQPMLLDRSGFDHFGP